MHEDIGCHRYVYLYRFLPVFRYQCMLWKYRKKCGTMIFLQIITKLLQPQMICYERIHCFLFEKFHMEQLKFVTVYTDLFHNKIVIRMKFNFKSGKYSIHQSIKSFTIDILVVWNRCKKFDITHVHGVEYFDHIACEVCAWTCAYAYM